MTNWLEVLRYLDDDNWKELGLFWVKASGKEQYENMTKTRDTGSAADDQWGRDPSIQSMRRVFAGMEKTQAELLENLRISPLDQRLRLWRQNALRLFEQQWEQTTRLGSSLGERQVADLYITCFIGILEKAGIPVPPAVIPPDEVNK